MTQLGMNWFWKKWIQNKSTCFWRQTCHSSPTLIFICLRSNIDFICPRSIIDFYMPPASNINYRDYVERNLKGYNNNQYFVECMWHQHKQSMTKRYTDRLMTDKVIPMWRFALLAPQKLIHNGYMGHIFSNTFAKTRHVFVKHECLRRQQSQNVAKPLSPTFWTRPTPRGMGCQWSVSNP